MTVQRKTWGDLSRTIRQNEFRKAVGPAYLAHLAAARRYNRGARRACHPSAWPGATEWPVKPLSDLPPFTTGFYNAGGWPVTPWAGLIARAALGETRGFREDAGLRRYPS